MAPESNHTASVGPELSPDGIAMAGVVMGRFEAAMTVKAPGYPSNAAMFPCCAPGAHDRPDPDDHEALRLEREGALAGAALLDEGLADLVLVELDPRELICSVSQAVLASLATLRDDEPVRYATEPTLELVLEELELNGELRRLDELGGRQAVEALVEDRAELREAQEALRVTVDAMAPVESEPVVLLGAKELGATSKPSMPSTNVAALPSSASGTSKLSTNITSVLFVRFVTVAAEGAVTRSRDSTPSPAPVTRCRHRPTAHGGGP